MSLSTSLSDTSLVPTLACVSPVLAPLVHLLEKWPNFWHLKDLNLMRY